jgi:hypothetical protein
MTNKALAEMLQAQPFKPFRICLADGREFVVHHPDFVARSQGGRTAVVFGDDEDFAIIDLLLVTSLEHVNGQSKRRR